MTVGVVGLGLIGGSFAKVYHEKGHKVLGCERDQSVLGFAMMSGVVSGVLDKDTISDCDLVLICIYPKAAIEYVKEIAPYVGKKPVIVDCCGTKRDVYSACLPISKEYGFLYVGGHPMAGTHNSGYKYSRSNMFNNAPMVIVPPEYDDIELYGRIKELLSPAGFGKISVTTAADHDEMIAFTSQLAHIVSNAYIKSPAAQGHKGFSAGSYKDMTRVAWLDPNMWTELFLENKDYLLRELDGLVERLQEYSDAMKNDDYDTLHKLLDDGRRIKAEVDGR